jgi:hypothetical protein
MRDAIDMAREAGFEVGKVFVEGMLTDAATMELKAFEALVRADEREACAKVADLVAREIDDTNGTATYTATAIRARGNT